MRYSDESGHGACVSRALRPVDRRRGWRDRRGRGLSGEPNCLAADARMLPTSQARLQTARILLVPARYRVGP